MDRKLVNLVFEPYINSTVSPMTGRAPADRTYNTKIQVYKGKVYPIILQVHQQELPDRTATCIINVLTTQYNGHFKRYDYGSRA